MSNKTVLITGAALRIGASIVRDLHANGMDVVIHYNNSGSEANALAQTLEAERPGSIHPIQADLLDDNVYTKVVKEAFEFKNRLDVLINNASLFYPSPIGEVTLEQWNDLVGINLKAPFFLAQQAAVYLRKVHGCIINITDIHAIRPLKRYPVYSAAKAGLTMLTKALAKELGPQIRVNAISPGAIIWPEEMNDETQDEILAKTTLKRQGTPEDINNAVRYLIFDADYMTGQVLTIDGGRTLYS